MVIFDLRTRRARGLGGGARCEDGLADRAARHRRDPSAPRRYAWGDRLARPLRSRTGAGAGAGPPGPGRSEPAPGPPRGVSIAVDDPSATAARWGEVLGCRSTRTGRRCTLTGARSASSPRPPRRRRGSPRSPSSARGCPAGASRSSSGACGYAARRLRLADGELGEVRLAPLDEARHPLDEVGPVKEASISRSAWPRASGRPSSRSA